MAKKSGKGAKGSKASRFKKSGLVYSVVGAACCNSGFRARLFKVNWMEDQKVRQFLEQFVNELGMDVVVSNDDVKVVTAFIAPLSIKSKHHRRKMQVSMVLEEITFETACDTFAKQVCPFWPCDDYSA